MRDPHVKKLIYQLKTPDDVDYNDNCPPIEHHTDDFTLELRNKMLTCVLKKHYPSIKEARAVVEPLLKSWELDVALKSGRQEIQFEYYDGEIIDRDLTPGKKIVNCTVNTLRVLVEADSHLTKNKYPDIPSNFLINFDAETLWRRYDNYLNGNEQLLSMAYFCLSYIEGTVEKSKKEFADKYKIHKKVLDKLGKFTSVRGDHFDARKGKGHSFQPLSRNEEEWIKKCIKIIIRRICEHQSDPNSLEEINLSNLPSL